MERFCSKCSEKVIQEASEVCSNCGCALDQAQPAPHRDESSDTPAPAQETEQEPSMLPDQAVSPTEDQQQSSPTPVLTKKKNKRPFIIAGAAATLVALAAVFALVILPAIKDGGPEPNNGGPPSVYAGTPGGREVSFTIGAASFSTNDPAIKMIEINQCLSYGFDSNTGEYYVMDSFVARKETAVFVALQEPLDPKSEILLRIDKDGEPVATLSSVELIDECTLLFHPRDISDVGFWEQGAYTFTFTMDASVAVRTTNFYEAAPMKVLAVPIAGYYSGEVKRCEGDWKQGSTMITATFPVAREDVEYILGPEIDLSNPKYDLDTKDGRKKAWQALRALQASNNGYTMIVGYMSTPTSQGYLGYTYGDIATVVCESEPDLLATVVHEMTHCYKIGDEYDGGSLNITLNTPPYGMSGRDIISKNPTAGTKEKIIGGYDYGINGSGSVIYPEQRAYWLEGRELLSAVSSYMGEGTGADSFTFWVSSDIWNHLFQVFTGQPAKNELSYGTLEPGNAPKEEHWGQCYNCFGNVYASPVWVECRNCAAFVLITGETFGCEECKAEYTEGEFTKDDLWFHHPECNTMIYYPDFAGYNEGTGLSQERIMTLEIMGDIDRDGGFIPEVWYAREAPRSALTANMNGEYTASIYDAQGVRLSLAYFDASDDTQINTKEGAEKIVESEIPVRVVIRFPESAAKVVLQKDGREIYTKELSAHTPEVSFTGLTAGQALSNQTRLTWDASDADGDELTFQIWYCRSDSEEYLLANNATGTTLDVDLTDYPGTDQGWFKILATDGARTGTNESSKVAVPYKAPDILNNIPEGKQYKVTDIVEIQGKVYDAQDGWLWSEGYEWRVDGRLWGNYGGFYFWHAPYMLKPGTHTITLTATNSAGLSSTKDYVIEIIEDESDLPDDWSRRDITLALRMGYYLPLNRLDSPMTRLEYAKMMFSVYSLVLPEGFELMPMGNILPEFTDMSNDMNDMDFGNAFVMVNLGLMEVKNAETLWEYEDIAFVTGEFDPHGTMTEREAMQILRKTLELSETQTITTYEMMDESLFIPELTEWGLFDEEGGPNAYNADEKLSKRLTLVRIARLIKYLHELEDKDYGIAAGFFDNYYKD